MFYYNFYKKYLITLSFILFFSSSAISSDGQKSSCSQEDFKLSLMNLLSYSQNSLSSQAIYSFPLFSLFPPDPFFDKLSFIFDNVLSQSEKQELQDIFNHKLVKLLTENPDWVSISSKIAPLRSIQDQAYHQDVFSLKVKKPSSSKKMIHKIQEISTSPITRAKSLPSYLSFPSKELSRKKLENDKKKTNGREEKNKK